MTIEQILSHTIAEGEGLRASYSKTYYLTQLQLNKFVQILIDNEE